MKTDQPVAVSREDTLTPAMDNVLAWRLGEVVSAARKLTGGDYIDTGLGLRRLLEEKGFGIVKLDPIDPLFIGQHPRHRLATRDGAVERIEHEITAWAFANDVDGAVRNDLLRRVRALLAEPAAEGEGK